MNNQSDSMQYVKIRDIGKIVTGKTPPTKNKELWDGEYPFYCIPDFKTKYIDSTEKSLSAKGIESLKNNLIPKNTIMVSCIGTVGEVGISLSEGVSNQQINSIIVDEKKYNPEYIYYCIKTKKKQLELFATSGSVLPIINKSDFSNFEIPIFAKNIQDKIAFSLKTIDEKIELNQQMNENLEEIANTLFKSWFIDFDPVRAKAEGRPTGLSKEISDLFPNYFEDSELGKIPKGWKISSLEHFCESVRDGTHDSPKSSEVGEYLITTRNIVNGEIDLSNAYKISKEDYEDVNRRSKVDQWDVLISMIGTVGEVCLVREEPKFAIKNLGLFKNRSRLHGEWLYYFLKSTYAQTHLRSNLRGTTQLYIPLGELRDFPFFCPPEDILSSFGELTSVLTDKIGHNLNENQTLSELRETLLPKLISGELKIPDVESLIEEASI